MKHEPMVLERSDWRVTKTNSKDEADEGAHMHAGRTPTAAVRLRPDALCPRTEVGQRLLGVGVHANWFGS